MVLKSEMAGRVIYGRCADVNLAQLQTQNPCTSTCQQKGSRGTQKETQEICQLFFGEPIVFFKKPSEVDSPSNMKFQYVRGEKMN